MEDSRIIDPQAHRGSGLLSSRFLGLAVGAFQRQLASALSLPSVG